MLTIIKIPKVGGKYKTKDGKVTAKIIDVFEDEYNCIRVYFSDYDQRHETSLDGFWRFFDEKEN
jgi:hypothetical protein